MTQDNNTPGTSFAWFMIMSFAALLVWSFVQYVNAAPEREIEREADERSWACSGARDSATGKIDLNKLGDWNVNCWGDSVRYGRR